MEVQTLLVDFIHSTLTTPDFVFDKLIQYTLDYRRIKYTKTIREPKEAIKRRTIYEYLEQTELRDPEVAKAVEEGAIIQAVTYSALWSNEVKLTFFIRSYKSRTSFTITHKPQDFPIASAVDILEYFAYMFKGFIDNIRKKGPKPLEKKGSPVLSVDEKTFKEHKTLDKFT